MAQPACRNWQKVHKKAGSSWPARLKSLRCELASPPHKPPLNTQYLVGICARQCDAHMMGAASVSPCGPLRYCQTAQVGMLSFEGLCLRVPQRVC